MTAEERADVPSPPAGTANARPSAKMIAYTPPRVSREPCGPVARRLLFYVPGYDPDAERRYRALFMRELRRYAQGFRLKVPKISRPVTIGDATAQGWTVETVDRGLRTETDYEILLWSDLVRRDMEKPYLEGAALNAWALLTTLANGTLVRVFRANWKCGGVILYPFVMSVILLKVLIASGFAGHGVLGLGAGWPTWLAALVGTLIGALGLRHLVPRLDRAFLYQLTHDCIFHWQHANGRRPDYSARSEEFIAHMRTRIREAQADEILIVGHSTGGLTAVELAARLLERDETLGREGPALSLLTLGSSMPIIALQPGGRALRADVKTLATSPRLTWVDYQAPQDWLNFPGFNPVREPRFGIAENEAVNPIIRSAKFTEIIAAETYKSIRLRPFRMHFQFLMANDHPGVFDIFALTLGSRRLRDRVLGEHADTLGSDAAGHCAAETVRLSRATGTNGPLNG